MLLFVELSLHFSMVEFLGNLMMAMLLCSVVNESVKHDQSGVHDWDEWWRWIQGLSDEDGVFFPGVEWNRRVLADSLPLSSAVHFSPNRMRAPFLTESQDGQGLDIVGDGHLDSAQPSRGELNLGFQQHGGVTNPSPASNDRAPIIRCRVCGASFNSAGGLKKHVNSIHLKKFPLYCRICGRGISEQERYKDHMNMHFNIKAHKCPYCSKCFTFKSDVGRHIRTSCAKNVVLPLPPSWSVRCCVLFNLLVQCVLKQQLL